MFYLMVLCSRSQVEPCGLDFLTSVGIGIGLLLKCRFSVEIGFGFGIEKSRQFFSIFFRFFGFFRKIIFAVYFWVFFWYGHIAILILFTLTWLSRISILISV
jgi:hypothetical protein